MAAKRFTIDGYGQLELNQVAFRRDGRIEAQCALDPKEFTDDKPAENGMLLAVDNVTRTIHLPKEGHKTDPIALNYSAERVYDPTKAGLKDFSLKPGQVYPRLGYLSVGDKFTTNCISYDGTGNDSTWTDDEKVVTSMGTLGTTPIYGGISDDGSIKVSADKPEKGPVLKVVKWYTMPDGQPGAKFQVLSV